MVGIILRRTANYSLIISRFDVAGWEAAMANNFDVMDATLYAISGLGGIGGSWSNSTSYVVGNRFTDAADGTLWQCLVAHTSATSGTFAADRAANPTFWQQVTNTVSNRGQWTTATVYAVNEFVYDAERWGVVVNSFTSDSTYDVDVAAGDILTIIDIATEYAAILAAETATAADVVTTNADVVLTNADVVLTNADVVLTGVDEAATDADATATAADAVQTALDVLACAALIGGTVTEAVRHDIAQGLSAGQELQGRANIEALGLAWLADANAAGFALTNAKNLLSTDTAPLLTPSTTSETVTLSTDSKLIIVEVFGSSGGGGAAITTGGSGFVNGGNGGATTAIATINDVVQTTILANGSPGGISWAGDVHSLSPKALPAVGTGQMVRSDGGRAGPHGSQMLVTSSQTIPNGGYSASIFEKAKGETGQVVTVIGAKGAAGTISGGYAGQSGLDGYVLITEIF